MRPAGSRELVLVNPSPSGPATEPQVRCLRRAGRTMWVGFAAPPRPGPAICGQHGGRGRQTNTESARLLENWTDFRLSDHVLPQFAVMACRNLRSPRITTCQGCGFQAGACVRLSMCERASVYVRSAARSSTSSTSTTSSSLLSWHALGRVCSQGLAQVEFDCSGGGMSPPNQEPLPHPLRNLASGHSGTP